MEKFVLRLEVGHESVMLDAPIPAEPYPHTHRWTVFVRSVSSVRLDSNLVEKVVFQLHEDFKCSRRVVTSAPFEVTETGYAGFAIPIVIRFVHCKREYNVEYDMNLRYGMVPQDKVKTIHSFEFVNPKPSLRKRLCHAKAELILPQRPNVSQPPSTSVVSNAFLDLFGASSPAIIRTFGGICFRVLSVNAFTEATFIFCDLAKVAFHGPLSLVARNGTHSSKALHGGDKATLADTDSCAAKEAAVIERKLAKKKLPPSVPSKTCQNGFVAKPTKVDTNGADDGSGCSSSDTVLCVETPTKLKLRISHLNVDDINKHNKKGKKRKRQRSDSGLDSEGSSAQLMPTEPSPSSQLPSSSSSRKLTQAAVTGQLMSPVSSNPSHRDSSHKASSSSSGQCSGGSSGFKHTCSPGKSGRNNRSDVDDTVVASDHRMSATSLTRLRDKIAAVKDPSLAQRIADLIAKHADFDVVAGHFLQFDLCTMNSKVIQMLESCFQKRS
ncbi:YEATS family protein [Trichuris suis]|nr:YEATS family protein [Trichuris suis]